MKGKNMAGYNGYSKSNNAVLAEMTGEMTATNFAKFLSRKYGYLKGCTAADIKAAKITESSWHHTSCKYNSTNYYDVELLDDADIARLANYITARKALSKWVKEGRLVVGEWFQVSTQGQDWYRLKIEKTLSPIDYFRLYQQFAGRNELEDLYSFSSAETFKMYNEAGLLTEEEVEYE